MAVGRVCFTAKIAEKPVIICSEDIHIIAKKIWGNFLSTFTTIDNELTKYYADLYISGNIIYKRIFNTQINKYVNDIDFLIVD